MDITHLMKKKISKNTIKNLLGLLLGAIGGYLYYHFEGCKSGQCAITSNFSLSILWGAIMGYLLFGLYTIKEKPKESGKTD